MTTLQLSNGILDMDDSSLVEYVHRIVTELEETQAQQKQLQKRVTQQKYWGRITPAFYIEKWPQRFLVLQDASSRGVVF